jgi:hypothetical protein
LVCGDACVAGGPDVHGELVLPIENRQHGDGEQVPGLERQARPNPQLAPHATGDVVLKVMVEIGQLGLGAIDVSITEHGSTNPHALLRTGIRDGTRRGFAPR